jgi:hypothetical protein
MKRTKTSRTAAKKPPAEPLPTPKPEPPEIQDDSEPDEEQKVSTAQDRALLKEQRRLEGEAAMDEYLTEQQAKLVS